MKDDIMFKAFFSKIGNEKFLKDFISAVLGENIKIRKVIHDKRLEQLARESKYGVLDLDVELENGKLLNIEMQMQNNQNIEERTTFYASKKITEQLGPKDRYEDLKQVIVIVLLNYNFLELPEYVTKTVRVAEKHRKYEINNEVTYYYIELKKFRKGNPNMEEPLNQWLAFIDMERGDLLDMAKKKNKVLEEAYEEYEELTGTEEVKRLAEIRLMSHLEEQAALATARSKGIERGMKEGLEEGKRKGIEQGKKEGIEQGKKEGLEQGKKEGLEQGKKEGLEQGKKEGLEQGKKESSKEIAIKMLKRKMPIEEISEITGLSDKEIKKLLTKWTRI